jgi:hypothetical protein
MESEPDYSPVTALLGEGVRFDFTELGSRRGATVSIDFAQLPGVLPDTEALAAAFMQSDFGWNVEDSRAYAGSLLATIRSGLTKFNVEIRGLTTDGWGNGSAEGIEHAFTDLRGRISHLKQNDMG